MILRLLIFIGSLLIAVSCISTTNTLIEKRLSLYFIAENIGTVQTIDETEIVVTDLKFALDRFRLEGEGDTIIETGEQITAIIFSYGEQLSGENLVLDVGLGITSDLFFNSYTMFLEPVRSRTNVFDNDFFGEDENYSLVIKGTIDEVSFEMTSTLELEQAFNFDNVQLRGNDETLVMIKRIDVRELFIDEENNFIDPRVAENEDTIAERVIDNLRISVSSGTIF